MNWRCLLGGHRWLLLKADTSRFSLMCHYNPNAGLDMDCERCGKQLRDAGDWAVVVDPPSRMWGPEFRARAKRALAALGVK